MFLLVLVSGIKIRHLNNTIAQHPLLYMEMKYVLKMVFETKKVDTLFLSASVQ
jgi:hypothetical protein